MRWADCFKTERERLSISNGSSRIWRRVRSSLLCTGVLFSCKSPHGLVTSKASDFVIQQVSRQVRCLSTIPPGDRCVFAALTQKSTRIQRLRPLHQLLQSAHGHCLERPQQQLHDCRPDPRLATRAMGFAHFQS
jgi:hypothetical protein